ncbi:MAG: prepilin-type N-terminal cleavage/methylation domain-containing protein [Deltaproteobacteria bacterium]|nr:prepilin-type N-terminal cleavage/methylation domain-containing protein [Deltaproteobacteria bacterium]
MAFKVRKAGQAGTLPGDGGFTLIELVVVVAILAILAAIMIPMVFGFAAKAKQSEAKELLATIYTAEQAYFGENNQYGTLSNVGFTPSASPKYYSNISINFTYTGAVSFTGSCSANLDGDTTMDIWEVTNASRNPTNTSNDIKG